MPTEIEYLKNMFTHVVGGELTDEEINELMNDGSDEAKLFNGFVEALKRQKHDLNMEADELIDSKESQRKQWADTCIRKQARIELMEKIINSFPREVLVDQAGEDFLEYEAQLGKA